ncbi:MAG: ATP-binding cassette domain-containing protein [Bacteroidota bacterium]
MVVQTLQPLQRFMRLLSLDKSDITYIYVYAIFSGLINLSIPLGVQAIIGLIAGGALSASLWILVAIVTGGTALVGILKIMQLTVTETIQRRIFARSAFDFAYRLPRLQLDTLVKEFPPELVNRFFDTLNVQKGIPKILMDFSTAVLNIVFGLLLISFYHPFFVFFGISLLLILFSIFLITGRRGIRTSLMESKYKYKVAYWLEELGRNIGTFKLSGGSDLSLSRTDGLVCNYLESRQNHFRVLISQYWFIVSFKVVVTASLLFLGSYLVIENRINIGQFVAAEIIVLLVMSSAEKLIATMETIYDVLTGLEKIGAVTDLPLERQSGMDFAEICTPEGIELEVKNLNFRFEDSNKSLLNGLTFTVNKGEKICIAGYSGAGKATLLQILSGTYTNYKGSVSYNGVPLQNLELESLRRQIGNFSAHDDIFMGTILENITLGSERYNMDDVVSIAENVGLSDYISSAPKGFETQLLPGGRNIPRKIRTKILLARSLATHPLFLVVEGMFEGLEDTERDRITQLLANPVKPWTMVAVSDDPTLASNCDRVLIMKDGKVILSGSFEEIRKSEHFSHVFRGSGNVISAFQNGNGNGLGHHDTVDN